MTEIHKFEFVCEGVCNLIWSIGQPPTGQSQKLAGVYNRKTEMFIQLDPNGWMILNAQRKQLII